MALTTTYPYNTEELIERAYSQLDEIKKESQKLKLPKITIINKDHKTFIKDFDKICQAMGREMEQVRKFFFEELNRSIECSVNESNDLVIKKIIRPTVKVKQGIIKYIETHVKCHQCKSVDTYLTKKNKYLVCNICSSTNPL